MSNVNQASNQEGRTEEDAGRLPLDVTMILTRQEVDLALQIKEAAKNHGATIRELSDFQYVQYALCCGEEETIEQILNRMEMVQAFKEEYQIQDTPEEGVELICQLTQHNPGFFLAVSYLPSSKNYMTVIDWAQLYPANFKTWQQHRMYLGYLYYSMLIKLPQFQAIREGSTILVECMDISLENFDQQFFAKMQDELMRWYPTHQRETFMLNSPTLANMVGALWRRLMSSDQRKAFHLGHQIEGMEGQRIDGLYKMPTPEIATQNLLLSVKLLLELRYKNEQEFTLDVPSELVIDDVH